MSETNIFPIGHPEAAKSSSHYVPSTEAKGWCAAECVVDFKHVAFHKTAVLALLSQPNAEAIRHYIAFHEGRSTIVSFAVDAQGNDLVGPQYFAIQNGTRCPPFCSQTVNPVA